MRTRPTRFGAFFPLAGWREGKFCGVYVVVQVGMIIGPRRS